MIPFRRGTPDEVDSTVHRNGRGLRRADLEQPSRAVTDPGIVTTRQAITPAGVPSVFQGRVFGVAWAKDGGDLWVLHASQVYRLDWKQNRVVARVPHGGTPGNQSISADPVTGDILFGRSAREGQVAASAGLALAHEDELRPFAQGLGQFQPGALSVSAEGAGRRYVAVPLVWENKVALLDAASGEVVKQVATGIAPFAAVIDRKGTTVWVSNLGGRPPKAERTLRLTRAEAERAGRRGRSRCRFHGSGHSRRCGDRQGDAHAGGWPAPNGPGAGRNAPAPVRRQRQQRQRLGDRHRAQHSHPHHSRSSLSQPVRGIAPTALQVSADGATLYVACGGINAVAVMDTQSGKIRGLIPTAWYPNGLALEPTGKQLAVSSLLGPGSGWRDCAVQALRALPIAAPSPCCRFRTPRNSPATPPPWPRTTACASPALRTDVARAGTRQRDTRCRCRPAPASPSLIEHVVFIIKENRTYDQVLGDMAKGNGDPSLVMFGADVTPNQHRLAEQFVLLDNFYATGGNSADGHQWLTQANETDYCLWPGYQGRSYPFDGTDPIAYSTGGFLWDYAQARGRTVRDLRRICGPHRRLLRRPRIEPARAVGTGRRFHDGLEVRCAHRSAEQASWRRTSRPTPASIPDVARARIFLDDLKRMESEQKPCRT